MESNGLRGMIQVSQETATLLVNADKEHWLTPREDKIVAKGKGMLQTFFADPTKKRASSCGSGETGSKADILKDESLPDIGKVPTSAKSRLINWMVDLLLEDIKKIVGTMCVDCCKQASHLTIGRIDQANIRGKRGTNQKCSHSISYFPPKGLTGIQEVTAALEMPKFDTTKVAIRTPGDSANVALRPEVVAGLKEYVSTIASLYRDQNQFHNFEVCTSCAFFLSCSPNDIVAHSLAVSFSQACMPCYNECEEAAEADF
jgi:hypothetical protein